LKAIPNNRICPNSVCFRLCSLYYYFFFFFMGSKP